MVMNTWATPVVRATSPVERIKTDVELEADQKQQNSYAKLRKKLNLFARGNQAKESRAQQNAHKDVGHDERLSQQVRQEPHDCCNEENKCYLTKRTFQHVSDSSKAMSQGR
jgi:hypothetical protein